MFVHVVQIVVDMGLNSTSSISMSVGSSLGLFGSGVGSDLVLARLDFFVCPYTSACPLSDWNNASNCRGDMWSPWFPLSGVGILRGIGVHHSLDG